MMQGTDALPVTPVTPDLLAPWPPHARRVDSLEALVDIYEPTLTLVSTGLALSRAEQAALESAAQSLPCFEFVKESPPTGASLEFALPWFEGHPAAETCLAQGRTLAALFADLFEAERLGVRLTLSDRPMCPRFHVDDVVCRLVVALAGPGSEFLDERDVRRKLLGAKSSAVEREGAPIHRLEPLEVGLFKGEAWPEHRGRGIVHRSPATAARRLVLTLDLL